MSGSNRINPIKISFGPYHHGRPCCQEGEREKEQFLLSFLHSRETEFEKYVKAIDPMVEGWRDAYDELESDWGGENSRDAFLKMMVVDGCCVLEILDRFFWEIFEPEEMDVYKHDLLLLENQIPLKLLQIIAAVRYPGIKDINRETVSIILQALNIDSMPCIPESKGVHILEVYRNAFLFWEVKSLGPYAEGSLLCSIPSATNLQDARIEINSFSYFERNKSERKISFNGKKLSLPPVILGDATTESTYMNVIMLERCHPRVGKYFSSYIYFMRSLLKNPADSKLLIDRGLINTTWDDVKVTGLYARLCERMKFNGQGQPFEQELGMLVLMLRAKYNKNSQPWRKDLFNKYLTSPWAIISIVVVVLSLALSAAQTVYTILGYYNPKN